MADVGTARSTEHHEKSETVDAARVDEGRWEGEGGGTLPKHIPGLPNSPSPNAPLSSMREEHSNPNRDADPKDTVAGDTSISSKTDTLHPPTSTDHKPVVYSKDVHPSVVEPSAQSSSAESHYSTLPASNSNVGSSTPGRKKSLSEKLEGSWLEFKAKASALFEKKKDTTDKTDKTETDNKEETTPQPKEAEQKETDKPEETPTTAAETK